VMFRPVPPRCTKCNSPPVNGQCIDFILFDVALLPLDSKGLTLGDMASYDILSLGRGRHRASL